MKVQCTNTNMSSQRSLGTLQSLAKINALQGYQGASTPRNYGNAHNIFPQDKVEISARSQDGRQVSFTSYTNKLSATVLNDDGTTQNVKHENLPRNIRDINDVKTLEAYLKQSYIRITTDSNSDIGLNCNLRLKGGGQDQQSGIISDFLKGYAMGEFNTEFLLKKIRVDLKEEPTVLSKQIIKAAYISYFTKTFEMNEVNTSIAVKRCSDIFNESLGKEPATSMLKSSYVGLFIKTFEMNKVNTSIAIKNLIDMGLPFTNNNEPAATMLKSAYVSWFTDYTKRNVSMNEINTQIAMKGITSLGFQLMKEPAKILLETKYVNWFQDAFEMNSINTQILKDRYLSMFGETLVNIKPEPNYGRFSSSDNDMKGYAEQMMSGIDDICPVFNKHYEEMALGVGAGGGVDTYN